MVIGKTSIGHSQHSPMKVGRQYYYYRSVRLLPFFCAPIYFSRKCYKLFLDLFYHLQDTSMPIRSATPYHHSKRSGQASTSRAALEMDKVMSLSRQKLRLESARGEPDLRKLIAHVCTVEHIEGWLRSNPPAVGGATLPKCRLLALDDEEGEHLPPLRKVVSEHSLSAHGTTGDLRSTVTAVREVGPDDDDDESDESSDSGESWNGSDTSDDAEFGEYHQKRNLLASSD